MKDVTSKIAEFIINTSLHNIPQKAIEKSKEAFLDWIAVTLAGIRSETGNIILDFIRKEGCKKQASIIGTNIKTSVTNAALAMGTLSHAIDFDDVLWLMRGHPSVTIFPALFALGEVNNISGHESIEAFIVGFEVEALIGIATAESHYQKGWHTTSTIGTIGAAAVGAKILGLDYEQTRNALGIAASQSSGLRSNFGTMTKPLHAGNAARSGVMSALLAKSGFTANRNILEAELGFANVFCGKDNKIDELSTFIGKEWNIITPGRSTKIYPSCRVTHSAIDCTLSLCKENKINPKDIEKIECYVVPEVPNILIYNRPRKGLEGKFSLQYCVAVAILDEDVGLRQFSDERVKGKDVQEMINKIIVFPTFSSSSSKRGAMIKIKTRQKTYEKTVIFPKGFPENPLTYNEMIKKFGMCVKDILTTNQINKILGLLDQLESLNNIKNLIDLCCLGK